MLLAHRNNKFHEHHNLMLFNMSSLVPSADSRMPFWQISIQSFLQTFIIYFNDIILLYCLNDSH